MKTNKFLVLCCVIGAGFLTGCEQRSGGKDDADVSAPATDNHESDDGDDRDAASVGPQAKACGDHMDCDDGIPCTQDWCEASTATCSHVPVNALCEDEGSPCLLSLCVSSVGCVIDADSQDGLSCDDDDACSMSSLCESGYCVAGAQRDCDDGNLCTNDSCDSASGCLHNANNAPCDDGSNWTGNDQCVDGVCKGFGDKNCVTLSDCDDGNPCTALTCVDGKCESVGATCDDGLACTVDSCDPADGCIHTPKNALCGEGEWCEPSYAGIGGKGCVACWSDEGCDDGNVCTTHSCVDGTCVYKAIEEKIACDDGDACTLQSFCIAGTCSGGDPKNCDDGLVCTKDWCDPDLGCFSQPSKSCDTQIKEACNGVDDDGDGFVDEPGANGCTDYWYDGDKDGFGKAGQPTCVCKMPLGYTSKSGDCDDADPSKTTSCSSGGSSNPPAAGSKFCSVRLMKATYELQGWTSALPADMCVTPNEDAQWCVDVVELKVYGGGTIIANAKCRPGETCNQAGSVWGVGYTGNSCKNDELVTLQGLFQLSPDCSCTPACTDGNQVVGSFGDPNLFCTVKP